MFFFALTPNPPTHLPRELSAHSLPTKGGMVVTWGSGGHLNSPEPHEAGTVLCCESLPGKLSEKHYWPLRLEFNPATGHGSIRRRAHSGRPLYYRHMPDGSFFAATHLRLLKELGVPFEDDQSLYPELFLFRVVMCPQSLVKGLRQLQSGEQISIEPAPPKGWKTTTTARFNPPSAADARDNPNPLSGVRGMLEAEFYAANPEPGTFVSLLSGGLDSTILSKLAKDIHGSDRTYSCVYPFEDPSDDIEERYARTAAQEIGTTHEIYMPTMAQYLHGVIDAIRAAEQPLLHLQSVLLHLVYVNVLGPRGYKIVANGEGADGLFGIKAHHLINMLRKHPWRRRALHFPGVPPLLRFIAEKTNRYGLIARIAGASHDPTLPLTDPRHIVWVDGEFAYRPWVLNHLRCTMADTVRGRAAGVAAYTNRDPLDLISIAATLAKGTQTEIVWSMAADPAGIGLFYPFPSEKIIESAYLAPWEYKLAEPKRALREVARGLGISEHIIDRPKAAFGIRSERYGPRGSVFEPLIEVAGAGYDIHALRSLQSGEIYRAQTLWTLINLALWRRLFILNHPPQLLHEELDREMHRLGVLEAFNTPGRVSPIIHA